MGCHFLLQGIFPTGREDKKTHKKTKTRDMDMEQTLSTMYLLKDFLTALSN